MYRPSVDGELCALNTRFSKTEKNVWLVYSNNLKHAASVFLPPWCHTLVGFVIHLSPLHKNLAPFLALLQPWLQIFSIVWTGALFGLNHFGSRNPPLSSANWIGANENGPPSEHTLWLYILKSEHRLQHLNSPASMCCSFSYWHPRLGCSLGKGYYPTIF